MTVISDRLAIRARLAADPAWAAYALGDLAPGLFEHTRWHAAEDEASLLMLFSALDLPVLFTLGPAEQIARLLAEIEDQPRLYLSIRPDILPLIHVRYTVSHETAMWRMVLDRQRFAPGLARGTRLTLADYPALARLYADGVPTGEAPDFFAPYMVENGVFFGVFEGESLVAAAGTHLVAPEERVAAVGNVYTRRDRRGRGLAAVVTGAVTAELLRGLAPGAVIALNVKQANMAAIKVYERLGFARYCGFYEGVAERRAAATDDRAALV